MEIIFLLLLFGLITKGTLGAWLHGSDDFKHDR